MEDMMKMSWQGIVQATGRAHVVINVCHGSYARLRGSNELHVLVVHWQ